MIINVTEQHIYAATGPNDTCPIQVAIEEIGLKHPFMVGSFKLWVGTDDIGIDIDMPPAIKFFTQDFDTGEPVQPFSFELPIEPYIRRTP